MQISEVGKISLLRKMTVEQANKEVVDEKKSSEPAPLAKEEIEALKAYAMGMLI